MKDSPEMLELKRKFIDYLTEHMKKGFPHHCFTKNMRKGSDEINLEYAVEQIDIFFYYADQLYLPRLYHELKRPHVNFVEVTRIAVSFQTSSEWLGAVKVVKACGSLIECAQAKDADGCREHLDQLKKEYASVTSILETLRGQITDAGGPLSSVTPTNGKLSSELEDDDESSYDGDIDDVADDDGNSQEHKERGGKGSLKD